MRDQKGFDQWADSYDQAVSLSDGENSYPFAGYREILGRICQTVLEKPGAVVLDLGFGTGTLAARLYEKGCVIFGQDFSERMIRLASEKMPQARLYQGDLAQGLAAPLRERRYDFIVATWSLHHLSDAQKIPLLGSLRAQLSEGGRILIGDVAFTSRADLERCRQAAGSGWDEAEHYFIAEELRQAFPDLIWRPVSHCAGILELAGRAAGADQQKGR